MEEQYRVFDRDGVQIDQISTYMERAYAVNDETSAKWPLSCFDSKCNPYTLNFGNWFLAENSDGLLPWAGLLDDLAFDQGYAMCWAYTPERLFKYRRGPRRLTLKGRAGDIFAQMIQQINLVENTPLVVGNIASNSDFMEETLNPTLLIDNLNRIIQRSGECYRFRPEVVDGRLIIYADWFPTSLLDTGLIIQDGWNITSDHPLNMNPPTNDLLSYGQGTDWATRIISESVDYESVHRYGRRQGSQSSNTKVQATLDQLNRVTLAQFKEPQFSFPISALNVGDTFKKLMPGALATYTQLVGQGFSNDGLGYYSIDKVVQVMNFEPQTQTVGLAI